MRPDDGRVVPAFINQALDNEPFSIFGDSGRTRSAMSTTLKSMPAETPFSSATT